MASSGPRAAEVPEVSQKDHGDLRQKKPKKNPPKKKEKMAQNTILER